MTNTAQTAMANARAALDVIGPGQRLVVLSGLLAEACFDAAREEHHDNPAMGADMLFGSASRMVLEHIKTLAED